MMKKLFILSLILLTSACSFGKKPSKKGNQTGDAAGAISGGGGTTVPGVDVDSNSTPLDTIANPGTSMRFLDARALTGYYKNVFKQSDYGYVHCKDNKPAVAEDCTDSIFYPSERPSMGSFDLGSPRMGRQPRNVNPANNLTLNYMRTLRAALSRECNRLVETELATLKAGNTAANVLIKTVPPTAADLDGYMKKLLGIGASGAAITIDFDAAGYVAAFNTMLAADNDKERAKREAFLGICIAVSMDPLVFLY